MLHKFIGLMFVAYMGITSLLFFFVALTLWLLTVLFDRRLVVLHKFTCFWASLYLWTMPSWKVKRYGLENLPVAKEPVVFVSNHQSQLDILLGFTLFHPFKWVSKAEVFLVPFIGWNMSLNGYIKLRRGSTKGIKRMLKDAEKNLTKGNSVFLFPEGTRSPDGEVKTFRAGAFKIAQKQKVSLVPVVINGTSRALPKNSLHYTGVKEISLEVLPKISYDEYKDMSGDELAKRVEELIREKVVV